MQCKKAITRVQAVTNVATGVACSLLTSPTAVMQGIPLLLIMSPPSTPSAACCSGVLIPSLGPPRWRIPPLSDFVFSHSLSVASLRDRARQLLGHVFPSIVSRRFSFFRVPLALVPLLQKPLRPHLDPVVTPFQFLRGLWLSPSLFVLIPNAMISSSRRFTPSAS